MANEQKQKNGASRGRREALDPEPVGNGGRPAPAFRLPTSSPLPGKRGLAHRRDDRAPIGSVLAQRIVVPGTHVAARLQSFILILGRAGSIAESYWTA